MYAARSYHTGGFRQVILSGGPISGWPVAVAMRDFLQCRGVPAQAMHVEVASRSTCENALVSKQQLDRLPGRKVLLTSDYHMFRARRVFAKVGVQVSPLAIPDVQKRASSWLGRWPAFLDLVLETCKIGYYWLRGWI